MGGVGSFNRANRTLYIGKMQESPDKKQTEETMLRHFGEWGKIVKCTFRPFGAKITKLIDKGISCIIVVSGSCVMKTRHMLVLQRRLWRIRV